MAHTPKPFFRTARNAWYVQIGTKQTKLCDGPKSVASEKLAWTEFHSLMTDPGPKSLAPKCPISANSATLTVGEVFEKFLDWCQRHRSPRTYEWTKGHIQRFCDYLRFARSMPATDLRPFHIVEWVDSKFTWGANQKRGAIVAVTRPFNWAVKMGHLSLSPVRGVEKPTPTKRDSRMTPGDFETLLAFVKDEAFRDLLVFAFEAGCRPQEARHIEARHMKLEHSRIEIPPAEAKGKKRWRVIYLSNKAAEIVSRLAADRPTGPLFLNIDGNPWKAQAIICRFQRMLVKMGESDSAVPRLPRFDRRKFTDPAKLAAAKATHGRAILSRRKALAEASRQNGKRFALYDIRHCFATRKLKEGHDPITVATLLGHKDATMLCRHYEEISRDGEHLRNAVNSA